MRRPLVIAAAAVLSGTLCGLTGIPAVWTVAAAVVMIAAVIGFLRKCRGRKMPLFFIVLAAAGCFLGAFFRASAVSSRYESEEQRPFFEKYEATNPGEFDYALYLKAMDVTCEEQRKALKTRNRALEDPLRQELGDLRELFSEILDRSLTEHDAGIMKAMLLGNKSDMQEEVKDLYQGSGISHLLAVSGLHVSLIGIGLFDLLKKRLRTGTVFAASVSAVTVLLYALFTGASASSLRAGIMFLLSMTAKMNGRKTDLLTSLCAAGAALLLWRPYLITQSGFLLSFTAIGGIILSSWILKNKAKREKERQTQVTALAEKACNALITCICVTLASLPVVACSYFKVPLYSIFLNMAVIPMMSAVFLSGAAVLAFGLIGTLLEPVTGISGFFLWFSGIAAAPGHYILLLYEKLALFTMGIPGAEVILGSPADWKILVYYAVLLIAAFFGSRLRRPAAAAGTLLLLYGLSLPFLKVRERPDPYITVLDVGQGDCFHIHAGKTDILLDCGSSGYESAGSRIAENYFLSKGIRKIDVMIVSHADADHTNGMLYLLSEASPVEAGMLVLPCLAEQDEKYDSLKAAAGEVPVRYARQGTALTDGAMECLCVYSETDPGAMQDTNRESSVWLCRIGNFRMLFTGDITEQEEQKICRAYGDGTAGTGTAVTGNVSGSRWDGTAEVLKCAHHGSQTANSEAFLDMVRPRTAVLSYGKGNRYGHPSEPVTERLYERRINIISTAENGAVMFRIGERGECSVCRFRDEKP